VPAVRTKISNADQEQYEKDVFNGDIAGSSYCYRRTESQSQIRDRVVDYELSELDDLVLAYAISIHKSQGADICRGRAAAFSALHYATA